MGVFSGSDLGMRRESVSKREGEFFWFVKKCLMSKKAGIGKKEQLTFWPPERGVLGRVSFLQRRGGNKERKNLMGR